MLDCMSGNDDSVLYQMKGIIENTFYLNILDKFMLPSAISNGLIV